MEEEEGPEMFPKYWKTEFESVKAEKSIKNTSSFYSQDGYYATKLNYSG